MNVILIASNAVPSLALFAPTSQLICVGFPISALASDLDGVVTNVQFFLNATPIATFTNPPYQTSISYDFAGPSTLTARAYDNKGALRETNLTVNFFTLPIHVISTAGAIVNGGFKLCMLGQVGKNYDVLASTNLNTTKWINIGVMESINQTWRFTDTNAANFSRRFYRARQQ